MLMCSGGASAYAVLTDEEIVDLAWADQTDYDYEDMTGSLLLPYCRLPLVWPA